MRKKDQRIQQRERRREGAKEKKRKGETLGRKLCLLERRIIIIFNNERGLEKAIAMHLISQLSALVFKLSL